LLQRSSLDAAALKKPQMSRLPLPRRPSHLQLVKHLLLRTDFVRPMPRLALETLSLAVPECFPKGVRAAAIALASYRSNAVPTLQRDTSAN
jgi:hypothetical protein